MSATERALAVIASGERFHLRDGAVVRGGYRVGSSIVLAYFDAVVLIQTSRPSRREGASVLGTFDEESAVAIAFRRRLRPRGAKP